MNIILSVLLLSSLSIFANDTSPMEEKVAQNQKKLNPTEKFLQLDDKSISQDMNCQRAFINLAEGGVKIKHDISNDEMSAMLNRAKTILKTTEEKRLTGKFNMLESFMNWTHKVGLRWLKSFNDHPYPHRYRVNGVVQAAILFAKNDWDNAFIRPETHDVVRGMLNYYIQSLEDFHVKRIDQIMQVQIDRYNWEKNMVAVNSAKGSKAKLKERIKSRKSTKVFSDKDLQREQKFREQDVEILHPVSYNPSTNTIGYRWSEFNSLDEFEETTVDFKQRNINSFDIFADVNLGPLNILVQPFKRYSDRRYLSSTYADQAQSAAALKIFEAELEDVIFQDMDSKLVDEIHKVTGTYLDKKLEGESLTAIDLLDEIAHVVNNIQGQDRSIKYDERHVYLSIIKYILSKKKGLRPGPHTAALEVKNAFLDEAKFFEGDPRSLTLRALELENAITNDDKKRVGFDNIHITMTGKIVRGAIVRLPLIVSGISAIIFPYWLQKELRVFFKQSETKEEIAAQMDEDKFAFALCDYLQTKYSDELDCTAEPTAEIQADVDEIMVLHYSKKAPVLKNKLGGLKMSDRLTDLEYELLEKHPSFIAIKSILFHELSRKSYEDEVIKNVATFLETGDQKIKEQLDAVLRTQDQRKLERLVQVQDI